MKVQEYNLTGNEKFSVWFTTMMMMTDAQLDHDSKARILRMAKIMCVGEYLDMQKLENEDSAEMGKSKEKQKKTKKKNSMCVFLGFQQRKNSKQEKTKSTQFQNSRTTRFFVAGHGIRSCAAPYRPLKN